ncbi:MULTISPECIES: aminoglycoside phosphotransferase family protein [unclassified Arthrobacter]|uniref:aminoglycoside phosphotransferase family protein n=1 Tax=unclassified Arthrobacter TaxID=235627 RepID=UPI00159DA251|nr:MULTISPECIES: aminoglycoside phosphotransferase family protein [unclassified Arthrobacter]MCQ9165639.1 aminoglycoside phosphotransferase family protein [Arthrobacter sp. STN4]NVN00610.1 aminoglycoside resistance protein [Arthrobacter sp. SDTb3-6]
MPAAVDIPEDLHRRHARSPEGRAWLAGLPGLVDAALQRWQLTVDLVPGTPPWHGHTGIVAPVRRSDGTPAALKIAFPYEETLLEPIALQLWNGRGMVQLLEQDAATCSMLIARLDDRKSLISLPMAEAVEVWGGVVRQLSIPPDARDGWARMPHIAATAERFCDELPARWNDLNRPFPLWLLEAALEVCQTRGAVGRRESRDVLVHTDLHYQNILASLDGSRYLGIDPQPQVGDAEFAVAPCLWNRIPELPHRDAEAALRRRCADLSAAAGLDADLAAAWAVVREVENALSYLETPHHGADAQRSLWVAGTMAGRSLPGLPAAHDLKTLD